MADLRTRLERLCSLAKPASRPGPTTNAVPPRVRTRWRRWQFGFVAALLSMLGAIALAESLGWPFLAGPLERALSTMLERRVSLSAPVGLGASDASTSNKAGPAATAFRVGFFGSVRVRAPWLEIAAPRWSAAPYTLQARDLRLRLSYGDLWRAWRGAPLRIDRLQAATLDGTLERLADGRASWQLRPAPAPGATEPPLAMPAFGRLEIANGSLRLQDAVLDIDVQARLSLRERQPLATPGPPAAPSATPAARRRPVAASDTVSDATAGAASAANPSGTAEPPPGFKLEATGRYRKLPLSLTLDAVGLLPWVVDDASAASKALTLEATVGRAHLRFQGQALDAMRLSGIVGRFTLTGPSLAAVGDPVGVTLPTTGPFRAQGQVAKQGRLWQVSIADATVGSSRLHGQFSYDAGRAVPLLSGELLGTRLMLVDLGPAVGTAPLSSAQPAAAKPGRVLPDRPFDLPALRAMDADVRIDIAELDLNSRSLEPLRPLRTHLQLAGGVLRLTELEARTGQGRLFGELSLDGRGDQALWRADLHWADVQLGRWLRQVRAPGAPPWVSGTLLGRASVQGQGRSTAAILGNLKGEVRTELRGGRVSHLAVEALGIDLAESIGVLIQGDDALTVQCAVADLRADSGVLRPRVMVLDTLDSSLWVDGSLSLASEAIDLRLVVVPKDFSPLTLRAPLRVGGSFGDPRVSIDKAPLARKLGAALLLALVNPFAALLPLIDPGDTAEAARGAAGCYGLKTRLPVAVKVPGPPAR